MTHPPRQSISCCPDCSVWMKNWPSWQACSKWRVSKKNWPACSMMPVSLTNGLNLMGVGIAYQYVIKGLIFIVAVAFDVLSRRK